MCGMTSKQSNFIVTCLYVQISRGDGVSRPSVFIDGGIHAREWIAPATVLYFIGQVM